MFEDKGVGSSAAGESRTLTPLLTGALKAPVSAIPPPRHVDKTISRFFNYKWTFLPSAVCHSSTPVKQASSPLAPLHRGVRCILLKTERLFKLRS